MVFKDIRCPKCGEPARSMRMMLDVRVPIVCSYTSARDPDTMDYYVDFDAIQRAEKQLLTGLGSEIKLVCSGDHLWFSSIVGDEDDPPTQ